MPIPLITQPVEDLTIAENGTATVFDLFDTFDDPFTTGQIARFEFADESLEGGVTNVLLFDQTGEGAPASVENFLSYVNSDDYANSIIHRSVPGFIVQGGGFDVPTADFSFDLNVVGAIPANPAVVNEFSPQRSNTRGTIAFAKLGDDPNSATNQWFFNLNNNAQNLDNQNEGFTVFGEVLTPEDLAPIDAISELEVGRNFFDESAPLPEVLSDIPLLVEDNENIDFVGLESVTLLQEDELSFEVIDNSNPELVETAISDTGELSLNYATNQSGVARITLGATNLLGDTAEERFIVAVGDAEPDLNPQESTVYRFLNQDLGVHLYTSSEKERDFIEENLDNYVSEGSSYVSVDPFTGDPDPQRVFRFRNLDTGTHLYTVSEREREFVVDNLANYTLEGESFFVYSEEQPGTIPVYRFFSPATGTHFYTPSEKERDFVEQSLPNYQSEGIAYYTFPFTEAV